MTLSSPLRRFCLLTLALFLALPNLAEARGGGRSGGGRAASGGRQASGFTAGIPQPRQARPAQARPTQATPRPSSLPSALPTPRALPSTRDLQSLLGQGPPKPTQVQGIQAGNFSPEQAAAAFDRAAAFDSEAASANAQSAASNFQSNFQSGPEPLSPAWYAEHPTAWQATHPHADTVAVASAAAVTSWLAYGTYPAGAYPTASSTVVYEDNSTTVVYEESSGEPQTVYATPVPAASAPVGAPVDESVDEPAEPASEQWLNLGNYEVKPTPDAAATQRLQLSVNRDGEINGLYHDQLTGAIESLSGHIDTVQQQATWSLDSNPSITFSASLDSLTSPVGSVTLTFPAGKQTLTLSREEAL